MSTSKEFEKLQNRRAELGEESLSLKEEQKNLEVRVKVLEDTMVAQQEELGENLKKRHEKKKRRFF